MLSVVFISIWLGLFALFAVNHRAYYLFILFCVFAGGMDAIFAIPRIFGVILPVNLIALQFALVSIVFLREKSGIVGQVIQSLGAPLRWLFGLLFVLILLNAVLGLGNPSGTFFGVLGYLNFALAFLCGPLIFEKEKDFQVAAVVVACAMIINLLPSLVQVLSGRTFMQFYYEEQLTSFDLTPDLPSVTAGVYRIRGFFYGHASFAFALTGGVSFLLLFLLPGVSDFHHRKPFVWVGILAGLLQLYFTFMRGAWLNVLCFFGLILFLGIKRKFAVAIPVLVILVLLVILPQTTSRFQSMDIDADGQDASNGRITLWASLLPYDTGSAIVGNGLGSYPRIAAQALEGEVIPSHSDYLLMLLECGWFTALILLIAFGGLAIRSIRLSQRLPSSFLSSLALVGGGILLAQVVQGTFENLMGLSWKLLPEFAIGYALQSNCFPGYRKGLG